MNERPELYFKNDREWYDWLLEHHKSYTGVYLIMYKIEANEPSMRWEEAVKIALCFGWIDSTVKRIDNKRRKQLFTPRKAKSTWSKLNKSYIPDLIKNKLMHQSGIDVIQLAKESGSWSALDEVDQGIIPPDLATAFTKNPIAHKHYQNFKPSYQRSYLYWLWMAKRPATRIKRIEEIIHLCENNIKQRT